MKHETITFAVHDAGSPMVQFEPGDTGEPLNVREVHVEMKPVMAEMAEATYKFLKQNYYKPGFILIGWRTHLRLRHEYQQDPLYYGHIEEDGSPFGSFLGYPIVVDDREPDTIVALPGPGSIRIGGRK